MSFDQHQSNNEAGIRVMLYQIQMGGQVWYLTNHDEILNVNGNVYQPVAGIDSSAINNAESIDAGTVDLMLPISHDVPQILRLGAPGIDCLVRIYQGHVDSGHYVLRWTGRMQDFGIEQYPMVKIVTKNEQSQNKKLVQNQLSSSTCTAQLYGDECGVNKAAYQVNAVLTGASGLNVYASAFAAKANGYFVGGYLEWNHPDFPQIPMRANIIEHSGNRISIANYAATIATGLSVKAYPGCNKLLSSDCKNKFNNTVNFRGLPWIDGRNPFDGTRIF